MNTDALAEVIEALIKNCPEEELIGLLVDVPSDVISKAVTEIRQTGDRETADKLYSVVEWRVGNEIE